MNAFRLNVTGWMCQVLGTLFLLLDSVRVGIRLPREGVTLGDPPALDRWYYHWASSAGFFLLLLGFVLSGVALWMSRSRPKLDGVTPPTPPRSSQENVLASALQAFRDHRDVVELFQLVNEQVRVEYQLFWQRFYAFAALHAGAFVLVTSNSLSSRHPIAIAGIVLAVVWVYVQIISLHYVNRAKPLFHDARELLKLTHSTPSYAPRWLVGSRWASSTDAALLTSVLVLGVWLIALWLVL